MIPRFKWEEADYTLPVYRAAISEDFSEVISTDFSTCPQAFARAGVKGSIKSRAYVEEPVVGVGGAGVLDGGELGF